MDRRTLLHNGLLLTASSLVGRRTFASASIARPNVLLLMSDQHKRSCMGAYGDTVARTPNLDSLAAKSVRFTNAYCANPVCTPSRASLMTGLYSHNHEAQDNAHSYSSRHKTMAHHFGAAGYTTALVGKMHWVDAQTHGFDYRLEFNGWFQSLGPKTAIYADELGRPNSGSGQPEIDDLWSDNGDPWKEVRHKDERQGAVHVGRVSLPREVVQSIRYNGPTPELRDEAAAKQHMAFYYANLAQMDDCVGQLLAALKETGHDRDTIIVYTSDHGEMLGDLGLWQKFEFYEGSCGVPLLMHIPDGAQDVVETPVSQVSLSATITDLSGVRQITTNDGLSFAALVRDSNSRAHVGPIFAEYALNTPRAKYMVRHGDWKYTFWAHDREELYNLKTDPAELHNVAADARCRDHAEHLKAVLFAWHRPAEA
jgi:arylsulfatase A-like enzyme